MSSDVIRIAILVDGGFFLKKYRSIQIKKAREQEQNYNKYDAVKTAKDLYTIALLHVYMHHSQNKKHSTKSIPLIENTQLYRIFYYDAPPSQKKDSSSYDWQVL